jgi:hypothetical protein
MRDLLASCAHDIAGVGLRLAVERHVHEGGAEAPEHLLAALDARTQLDVQPRLRQRVEDEVHVLAAVLADVAVLVLALRVGPGLVAQVGEVGEAVQHVVVGPRGAGRGRVERRDARRVVQQEDVQSVVDDAMALDRAVDLDAVDGLEERDGARGLGGDRGLERHGRQVLELVALRALRRRHSMGLLGGLDLSRGLVETGERGGVECAAAGELASDPVDFTAKPCLPKTSQVEREKLQASRVEPPAALRLELQAQLPATAIPARAVVAGTAER